MKNTQNIASLIAKLEYEIGKECYNPNSYDGYTGIEGLGYRYPVSVYQNENMRRYRGTISSLAPSEVHTMKYVFGSNHLFVGKGLYNVLSALEKRYGIDFNELEEKLSSDNQNQTRTQTNNNNNK
ncbi:MAG: hypothetical protein IJA10_10190 [Lachnospiraceae bacterium]|nr:hypothetical protein [Lachnospiraceae bacterium]